jgi:hypothetical protein
MNLDIYLFLLSFPLSILANLSSDYIHSKIAVNEEEPLKDLFVRSFLLSLRKNKKRVNLIGQEAITKVEKIVTKEKGKLFEILQKFLSSSDLDSETPIGKEKIKQLAEIICTDFNFNDLPLAFAVVKDCLFNYQVAFYSELSEKEGMHVIINSLRKINSDIARREDIEKLRILVQEALLNQNAKNTSFSNEIKDFIREEIEINDSYYFSNSIVDYFASLKKKIQKLTKDQYQIIHHLRFNNRVMISGCAGSGKTLLAAEKAIRLDQAGLKTLILCHNPHLATFISKLISTDSIDVYDVTSFILDINGRQKVNQTNWNEYVEPLDSDIENAFDQIIQQGRTYEAIIIDEGQDFRDSWWIIIDALQEKSMNKIFYIFYDDNQALLPLRSIYPLKKSPFSMSKNCRNGGNIFEIVKKFHPNAPLTSQFLLHEGIANITPFNDGYMESMLELALQDLFSRKGIVNKCIITNESSYFNSPINHFQFCMNPNLSWKKFIQSDLRDAMDARLSYISSIKDDYGEEEVFNRYPFLKSITAADFLRLPSLSANIIPTNEDISKISVFAQKLLKISDDYYSNSEEYKYFTTIQGGLSIIREYRNYENILLRRPANLDSRIEFYSTSNWYRSLPSEKILGEIVPYTNYSKEDDKKIPLYTLDLFKGLESDGIILFINNMNFDIEKELYIGSSRAIGYLNIVINKSVIAKIKKFQQYL